MLSAHGVEELAVWCAHPGKSPIDVPRSSSSLRVSGRRLLGATCLVLITPSVVTMDVGAVAPQMPVQSTQVLPIFRPLVQKLTQAAVPVYLPSWLPNHPR